MEKCIGCYACIFACARRLGFISVSKSAIQVKTHGGIERGFGVVVCHGCVKEEVPSCVKACKPRALKKRQGGGAVLNPDLCNSCGECVKACIIRAIVWDDDKKKPIMCIHCGSCAKYCPRGVLGLVKAEKELI